MTGTSVNKIAYSVSIFISTTYNKTSYNTNTQGEK